MPTRSRDGCNPRTIDEDRYPLSPRFDPLKSALAKLDPAAAPRPRPADEPLPEAPVRSRGAEPIVDAALVGPREQPQQQALWTWRRRLEQRAGDLQGHGAGLGFRLLEQIDPQPGAPAVAARLMQDRGCRSHDLAVPGLGGVMAVQLVGCRDKSGVVDVGKRSLPRAATSLWPVHVSSSHVRSNDAPS